MTRRKAMLTAAAVSVAALVAGCGGGGSTSGRQPGVTAGPVHGSTVASRDCAAAPQQPVSVDRAAIRRLVLCPLSVEPPQPRVTLPAGSVLFTRIVDGLATPGRQYGPGTACAAYADVDQRILARAGHGWLLVDVPRDSCGHYDRALLTLLSAARRAGTGA